MYKFIRIVFVKTPREVKGVTQNRIPMLVCDSCVRAIEYSLTLVYSCALFLKPPTYIQGFHKLDLTHGIVERGGGGNSNIVIAESTRTFMNDYIHKKKVFKLAIDYLSFCRGQIDASTLYYSIKF